jgi:hypothetical protein
VVGAIVLVFSLLLNAGLIVLVVRSLKYGGAIVITTDDYGKRIFSLEIGVDPDEIQKMGSILFKVIDQEIPGQNQHAE